MSTDYETNHTFTIERFCDGDTVIGYLRCRCCGASHYSRIRIAGIESWELKSAESHKAITTATALTNLYRGVSGPFLGRSIRKDRYGRIIGDIGIEGKSLSILIVEGKFGWWGVGEPEPHTASLQTREGS